MSGDRLFAALAVASGGSVNPIQRGDAGVQDSELARSIRAIAETDGGAWIVEGEDFPMNQYPLLVGAPTINAGNLYPALERWRNLDPAETAKKSWNRYAAGIRFDVRSGAPVSIRMTGFDTFRVECPPDTLPRLGVRHVLSRRDLEPLSGDAVRFLPEVRASGWTVYSVETAEGVSPESHGVEELATETDVAVEPSLVSWLGLVRIGDRHPDFVRRHVP